jgi:dolichol kinase
MPHALFILPHDSGLGGFGRNKGVLGFIGGALFCFPFNYRVLSLAKLGANIGGQKSLVFASLALGFAGAFADLAVPTPALTLPKEIFGVPVPPLHVDDNFVVPIVSGFACTKTFGYLGWPTDLQLAKFILF